MTLYFINPGRTVSKPAKKTKRAKARRKMSAAQKRAFLARMAAARKGSSATKSRTASARSQSSPTSSGTPMAKRRKSSRRRRHSTHARRNPPAAGKRRSHRRGVRRNPPAFSVNGIIGDAMQGAKDAALITAGKMATNAVSRLVPVTSPVPAIGVRVAVALAAGIAARQVLGRDASRFVLAGGLTAPIESAVRATNVPLLTSALASDESIRRFMTRVGSYPQVRAGGVGSYPQARRLGDANTTGMMSGRYF